MSTPVFLEQHLQRLKVPHPAVQQAVVVGVFEALAKTPGMPRADRDAAVEQCLACDSKVGNLHTCSSGPALAGCQPPPPRAACRPLWRRQCWPCSR